MNKFFIFFLLFFGCLFFSQNIPAQKFYKIFLNEKMEKVSDKSEATYYQAGSKLRNGNKHGTVETYFVNGPKYMSGYYENGKKDSIFTYFYRNGNLKRKIKYNNGKPIDTLKKWYKNGHLKETGVFDTSLALKGFNSYRKKHYKRINYYDSTGKPLIKSGDGIFKTYYTNNQIRKKGGYKNGLKEGQWLKFGKNGDTSYIEKYKNGNLINGVAFSKKDKKIKYEKVQAEPVFKGGDTTLMRYISKRIHYPLAARFKQTEGKVYVQFTVDKKGRVKNPEVISGIGSGCDKEALRVVKNLPKWKPGKKRGFPVSVRLIIPIRFTLNH